MRKLSRFGRFASNSTFPGIKFAYQSQTRFGTIFWSTTTLVGFAVGCYVCFGVLSAFSESPTYTIISQEPSISLRFPSITFCLLFRTTMNRLALLNITKTEDIEYLTHSFFTFTSPSYFDLDRSEAIINSSLTSNKSESQLHQLLEKYSMAELITNYLTPSCADIAFLCALGPNSRPVSCCSQPHEIFVASNGPCYSFDIINNYTQKVRSTMGKAMVVMNLPPLANLSNSTFYNYDSSGIQIFSTKEAASVEDNPIFVNRGSNSVVSLTLNKRIRLSSDQNPCQEKKSPYEHCFFRCITASALEWCHCIGLNTFIEQNSSSICTAREAYDCQKKYSGMQPGPEVLLFGKCDDQCRIPCETYQYAIIASSMLANHPEAPNILENKNFGTVGDRIAMWIYYPELYINVITEKYQFTWQTLLSNIGGIYGLWIGAIVTGVIHIFYSLFTSLWEILCERQGRQGDIV